MSGSQAPITGDAGEVGDVSEADVAGAVSDAATPGEVPEVIAARERLAAIADAPVHEHPQLFDEVQRLLTAALDPQAGPVGGRPAADRAASSR